MKRDDRPARQVPYHRQHCCMTRLGGSSAMSIAGGKLMVVSAVWGWFDTTIYGAFGAGQTDVARR